MVLNSPLGLWSDFECCLFCRFSKFGVCNVSGRSADSALAIEAFKSSHSVQQVVAAQTNSIPKTCVHMHVHVHVHVANPSLSLLQYILSEPSAGIGFCV